MKFLIFLIIFVVAIYFGVNYALRTPGFYEYIYSKPEISPKFCYYYGKILKSVGKSEAAMNFYKIIVSTYHSSEFAPLSLVSMADIYEEKLQTADALKFYEKFISEYPLHYKANRVRKNIEIIRSRR